MLKRVKQHYGGLDGLKGLAMIAIICFHLRIPYLQGGFLGVDIFFVIAGFLVAVHFFNRMDSLPASHTPDTTAADSTDSAAPAQTFSKTRHAIAFRLYARLIYNFYKNRVKRLYPALILLIAIVFPLGYSINPDIVVHARRHMLAALVLGYNWLGIATGSDYFAESSPELLRHLWFVSILAQFYLVAPLLIWLLQRWCSRLSAVSFLVGVALLEAIVMAVLYQPDTDPTLLYYHFGTHSYGLLLGMACAFWLRAEPCRNSRLQKYSAVIERMMSAAQLYVPWFAVVVFSMLIVLMLILRNNMWAFRGGMIAVSLLTAGLVLMITQQRTQVSCLLENSLLRMIGRYSYGIYLWHWVVFVFCQVLFAQSSRSPVAFVALIVVVTILLTVVSSYCWQEPLKNASSWSALWWQLRDLRTVRSIGFMCMSAIVCVGAVACYVVAVIAPSRSQVQILLEHNAQSLQTYTDYNQGKMKVDEQLLSQRTQSQQTHDAQQLQQMKQSEHVQQDVTAHSESQADQLPTAGDHQVIDHTDKIAQQPPQPTNPYAPQHPPTGEQMTIIGDSVTLASLNALIQQFPNADIDAKVSRSISQIPAILEQKKAQQALRTYVVVAVNTNAAVTVAQFEQIAHVIGDHHILVLVTGHAQRSWVPVANKAARDYANAHPLTTVLVDWDAAVSAHSEMLNLDGIHPKPEGGTLFAQTLLQAIEAWRSGQ